MVIEGADSEGIDFELIDDLARDLVSSIVPAELPLFPATSKRFREHPATQPGGRDDILAFGPAELVAFMTPIIWMTTAQVVEFVGEAVKESASEHAGGVVTRLARRAFGKGLGDKEKRVKLTAPQLAEVRSVALKKALSLQLPREQAQLLADALVGTLAV